MAQNRSQRLWQNSNKSAGEKWLKIEVQRLWQNSKKSTGESRIYTEIIQKKTSINTIK